MKQNENDSNVIELSKKVLYDHPHIEGEVKLLNARAFCGEIDYDKYRKGLFALVNKNQRDVRVPVLDHEIGMSQREIHGYSFLRAMRSAMENGGKVKDCPEADYSQQVERNSKNRAEGFFVPSDPILGMSRRDHRQRWGRDLNANTFGAGGAMVATDVPTSVIELLRNRTNCIRLGATLLSGLEGNCALPRQTAANTAQSVPETTGLTGGNPVLDQVALSPRRVGATCIYSKQLLLQSSVDVENFVRDDLAKVVAIDHDRLALNGQGGNSEPLGIMNTPGIGSIVFGGTATWAQVVSFETTLGQMNADRGRMAWMTTPQVRGRWKGLAKNLIGTTVVAAVPIWEPGQSMPDDEAVFGIVNQYTAASTNQIPNNQVLFGNWMDLIIAMWGGWDVVINPYSLDINAQVRITINTFIDIALRHAQSFCVSSDAGNN